MSDLPATREYERHRVEPLHAFSGAGRMSPDDPHEAVAPAKADAMHDELIARIAELEEHAEHDEDNLEGLQHALVRANQLYTQAEAALEQVRLKLGQKDRDLFRAEAERDESTQLLRGCTAINRSLKASETQAEAALAERDRMLERIRQAIVRHKQEAALYNNEREYDCLTAVLRIIDDIRTRAEEGSGDE